MTTNTTTETITKAPMTGVDRFGEQVPMSPGDTLHDEFNTVGMEYLGDDRWIGWVNIPSGDGVDRWLRCSEKVHASIEAAESYADHIWERETERRGARR